MRADESIEAEARVTVDMRRRGAPNAPRDHPHLMTLVDERATVWAPEGGRRETIGLPFDVLPHDLCEAAALRARYFEDALIGLSRETRNRAVVEDGRRARNDLAAGKAHRAALGEGDRIAFGADFHSIDLVEKQNLRRVAPQIARRLRRHHLQRTGRKAPREKRVAAGVVALPRQQPPESRRGFEGRLDIADGMARDGAGC